MCRSFLSGWVNPETGSYQTHGRNNLGVVSLNLPRIAIESRGDMDEFWALLEERLVLCRDALEVRINSLENTPASVAPILYMEGAFGVKMKADEPISNLFKNGRASISLGYIGLHEMMNMMFGHDVHPYDNHIAQAFAEAVVARLRQATDTWKKETGYGYGLYSTPSESLCDRFCRLDQAEFGIIDGVTDKGYYTNSFHLDVLKKVTPLEKFQFEQRYPALASGGHICYAEYPDMKPNLEALEACWDYAVSVVPYIGTNTPVDECFECGYDGEFTATKQGYSCPKCGCRDQDKISVVRRTCGYLGNVGSIPYNEGKQQEIINRVKHC